MRQRMSGERVVHFESRLGQELSELVRRSGGIPVRVPAVVERRRPAGGEVGALLDLLGAEGPAAFVFSTGVGVQALFDEARALGRAPELRDLVQRGGTVCRGPKAVAALYREGVGSSLRARSPYTTDDLLEALGTVELRGLTMVLVHYGERNEPLVEALTARGAVLLELLLYGWELPEDPTPLAYAAEALIQGEFAAAAFTTQIQARHLMHVATWIGRNDELVQALRSRVVVAAIGPTCARVLDELGVPPHVVPDPPKMGAMLDALVGRLTYRSAA
ncbi:MAG TPA: uroporphyrinogen-III synthase [Myxococcaceae bacterium]|nr:uroporphyrinogen-III synthase [Myxococcaceae bacterium]